MSSYFVKSAYNDGASGDSQIIEDFNRRIKNNPDHLILSIFKDASGCPTSASCKCGKFHRIKKGKPDIENTCDETKVRVPSIIYDVN